MQREQVIWIEFLPRNTSNPIYDVQLTNQK